MLHTSRRVARILAVAALSLVSLGAAGCRVNSNDLKRWETTELGPTKLFAVVTHEKFPWDLRTDAAESLIRMKPRSGRRLGLQCSESGEKEVCLQKAMADMSPEERRTLVSKLLPILKRELAKLPTQQQGASQGEAKIVDDSVPYKDAAFAILTYDKPVLVSDDAQKTELKDLLISWATAAFDKRVNMTSQLFGLEQVLRQFGADGVRPLTALISPDSAYDKMAALIGELGDPATKEAASAKLVEVGKYLEGNVWFTKTKPLIEAQYKANNYNIPADKLDGQVNTVREDQLVKVFSALKRVGGRAGVDYLLGVVAADKSKPEKRRQAALAAIEGKVDRTNAGDIDKVLAIASAEDTPDSVRDLAFQRCSELPREVVAPKLFGLFESTTAKKNWKIRWVAASTILKMSTGKDVPEFFDKLPKGAAPGFAMSEPLNYGELLGKVKDPAPKDTFAKMLSNPAVAQKLTAVGYFYAYGKAADVPTLQALEGDKTAVPKTEEKDAAYQCAVPKEGNPAEKETKPVATVGDFVKLCVLPTLAKR